MRGEDQDQQAMFSYISPEARVPEDHPLRSIRIMVDNALGDLAPLFKEMYSHTAGLQSRRLAWPDLLIAGIFFLGAGFVRFVVQLAWETADDIGRIARLEEENITDPLTGICNRRHLDQRLAEECSRAKRYHTPLSAQSRARGAITFRRTLDKSNRIRLRPNFRL